MSFLSRIKEMGKTKGDDEVPSEALSTEGMVSATGTQVVDTETGASTIQPGGNEAIISESAPSEFPADYQRQNEEISEASLMEPRSGLPLVGHLKLDRQQRLLGIGLAVGVLGLVLSAFLSVNSADRRAGQSAATGQALMQSQRLAKSVSQALIGRAPAFDEVSESSKVLASNVRGLVNGDDERDLLALEAHLVGREDGLRVVGQRGHPGEAEALDRAEHEVRRERPEGAGAHCLPSRT